MKHKLVLSIGVALIFGVMGGYLISQYGKAAPSTPDTLQEAGSGRGRGNGRVAVDESVATQPDRGTCLADGCLAVTDLEYPAGELTDGARSALDEAIKDEYKALSTYEAVIAKFGSVRPFSMIKGAEEQHIASLKAVYDKYGLELPENTWTNTITAPSTLQEACQTGVDAEIANASLYNDTLLPAVAEYEDITAVFNSLMNASQDKHLPAFERCN